MKIYYNPKCSKCRETLKLIESKGKNAEIVDYLHQPPTAESLRIILRMLGIPASELIRRQEQDFADHFKNKNLSEEEWINAMTIYPKLIQRPIVIEGNRAIIGRPPEKVLELIS